MKSQKPLITSAFWLLLFMLLGYHNSFGQNTEIQRYLKRASEGSSLPLESLLIDVEEDSIYFSELKGEWLFLDYWSTSCIPCIKEMPYVRELHKNYQGKGLRVVMINLDKTKKKWKRGIRSFTPPEPNYRTDRKIQNAFFAINLVELTNEKGEKSLSTMMPQYVLINPQGKIVDKSMLKPSDPEFKKTLNKYMNN